MNFARFKLLAKRYKYTILGVLVLLGIFWFAIANATEKPPPPKAQSVKALSHSDSHADASSQSSSQSDSQANATSGDSTSSADNAVSVSVEGAKVPKYVASVVQANLYPTDPCMSVASGGAQTQIVGVGFGKSYANPECEKREAIRAAQALGMLAESRLIWCSLEVARILPECPMTAMPPTEPIKCDTAECVQAVEQRMDERMQRMEKVWKGDADK